MKRILLTGYIPGANGVSTCVHNMYQHLDKDRFDWIFLVADEHRNRENELKPIREMGAEIIFLEYTQNNFPQNSQEKLRQVMSEIPGLCGVHAQDINMNVFPLLVADELQLPIKVIQYHNPVNRDMLKENEKNPNERYINNRKLIAGEQFCRLACSDVSGEYAYGNYPFRIFPNAIDLSRFTWNPMHRTIIRKKLGIPESSVVLGYAAIYLDYKNPMFAARVFEAFHRAVPDSHMILCGEGPMAKNVHDYFEKAGILPFTHFLGKQTEIEVFMNTMDLLLMPSEREGLPYLIIEAQAAGLPCLISDRITDMACITPLVRKCSLEYGLDVWVDEARRMLHGYNRKSFSDEIRAAGYDIQDAADELMSIYMEQIEIENLSEQITTKSTLPNRI